MRLTFTPPSGFRREIQRISRSDRDVISRAAHVATDRASREAQAGIRARIRAVGLGRLANAVGQTSSLKKRAGSPYGVIFAKGGDESLAGGALEAYSQGATIRARNRRWLAFPTEAVQRRIGGRRMTPERYRASGLVERLGKLEFVPLGPGRAVLIARKVTLHPITGRAKAAGPRTPRSRIAADEVVVFILIRVTRRAQRFDSDAIVRQSAGAMPTYLADAIQQLARKRPR